MIRRPPSQKVGNSSGSRLLTPAELAARKLAHEAAIEKLKKDVLKYREQNERFALVVRGMPSSLPPAAFGGKS